MQKKYNLEMPTEYSRWHHLAAYDEAENLIGISDWIDPVHVHGLPFDSVYVEPMREHVRNKRKLPFSYVQLGPTNSCNLACEGCYSSNCRSGDTLEYEQVESVILKVAEQVKNYNSTTAMVSFHGPGEPLCNAKNRETVLESVKLCNKLGLANRITTNASFNDDNYIEQLIQIPSLKLIWVSMKAGTKDTYREYTGRDKFEQVQKNMQLIVKMKEKYNRNDLTLKCSTEISKYNVSETLEAAKFAKITGFDIFKPALHSVDFQKVYIENTEAVENLRESLKNIYDENFNSLYWEIPKKCSTNYYADKFPSKICYQVESRIYFGGKGMISPCINWLDNHTTDYDFGNINDLNYFENSDSLTEFNKNGESFKLEHCKKCSDPWVSYFHQWIKTILEKDINANIVKIFDSEISKNYPNLADQNVLNNYDPREKYYD